MERHPVLVLSGHCNKVSQTGLLINNRNLFLTVLETSVQEQGANMVRFQ